MDTDLYRMAQKIEDALMQHDTGPCLVWCAENKSKLKKIKVRQPTVTIRCSSCDRDGHVLFVYCQSCLEFRVRVQDFIEMIKADKRMEAIRLAG